MRFERLHIPAFGPFTNLELNFPAKGGDLHIIYGANEAGKSSLLRTFRDLLFGIHGQSPDNFLHEYQNLRITAEIINRAGERLFFQRRKGNKNTLLDAEGQALPENALMPFLGSVDQEYFSAMFGLGTKELREGAEQLLHGQGDLGHALFSASMGGTPVQEVLKALASESDQLFKGRATANVSIRPTTNAYKDLMKKSRDAIVSPDVWESLAKDLAAAEKARAELVADISSMTRELEWISRCEDALPTAGRLGEELQKLAALPLMPEVSSDFVERARAAREAASAALEEVTRLIAQRSKFELQLTRCQTAPALLAGAAALDLLHQDLGAYRERKNALINQRSELAGLEEALRAGMRHLALTGDFTGLETLRVTSAARLACEEAADNLRQALEEHDKNTEKTENIQTQIKALERQLEALPEADLTDLRCALSVAAEATAANKTLAASESEVARLAREAKAAHKKLTGAPPDLDATGNLSIPGKSVIRRFDNQMAEINREIKGEDSNLRKLKKQIESLQAELERMQRRGELPSEQGLSAARAHRERGWSLVLAEWKGDGSKEEFVSGTPLEQAFPAAVIQADQIADQLREQAEAVAQAEEKRFQIAQSEVQRQEAKTRVEELQSTLKESQCAWEALWSPCGVKPLSPAEMEEWHADWSDFAALLHQLSAAEEAFLRKSAQVRESVNLLAAAVPDSEGKGFTTLYNQALKQVQKGEKSSGQRLELANRLREFKGQLESFEQNNDRLIAAVTKAQGEWKAECRQVGMPETLPPKSGLILLQERKELLAKFDSWKGLSAKSGEAAEVVLQYEKDVREKAAALGARGDTTEAQEADLWNMLTAARTNHARREQLEEQIAETSVNLKESQELSLQAEQTLQELIHLAKLGAVEELEPLLANLELRDRAQGQVNTFRDTLSGLARGQSVDEFLARVTAEESETLAQRKEILQRQKQEQETALQELRNELYALSDRKKGLEAAGDAAADYRQQAESCAARLQQDASRFVRLRLASHFLQAQIERFRKENQAPLLEKSGEYFKNITKGAFSGLGANFHADDTPILVGLRPDNTPVSIAGMSDGTRDQLYLALRLAALEQYLEQHEPMPLILDDLLITFDNNRAAAILPQLSALSQRTQIFLFTHHEHLVELCGRELGKESFHLHHLTAK
ncbi:MAG: AAA family ATPase [Kiritimatiellae bacterium]|nr:AAA family ATPase [Kiritimatiellia bacterium]